VSGGRLCRNDEHPCCYTCALLAWCLGPSPPPCALHVPVGPATALLLQSATEHLFPPPCAMHVPAGPAAALLLQSATEHLFPPPWAMHLVELLRAVLVQPG